MLLSGSMVAFLVLWFYRNIQTNDLDGFGTLVGKDGSKYEGFLKRGKLHGKGRKTIENGDSYEGTNFISFFNYLRWLEQWTSTWLW